MKIKTYHSESVTKALEQIKEELGPGAVILNTKRSKKRKLMGLLPTLSYEITAASERHSGDPDEENAQGRESAPRAPVRRRPPKPKDTYEVSSQPPRPRPAQPAPARQELARASAPPKVSTPSRPASFGSGPRASTVAAEPQIARLSAEIDGLRKLLIRSGTASSAHMALNMFDDLGDEQPDWRMVESAAREMSRLVWQGIDDGLAQSLMRFAARKAAPDSLHLDVDLRRHLHHALERMVSTSQIEDEGQRAAIFIGPTGVGKTTTLAKLAAIFALGDGKRVQLITIDTYRIAAAEQLKTYADIIGVPIRVVSGVDELAQALDEATGRDCVLIDTTGHSHKQLDDFGELAEFARARSDLEKHLVVSATTKPGDLREIIEGFAIFAPDKLVFTKLDETSTYGSIASEAILSGIPLSYLTDGQGVPDDLRVPTPKAVADLVVPLN